VLIQQIELRRSQPDYMFNRLPRALGLIGPPSKDALPILTELLHGNNSDTALYAAEAMCRIDPQQRATVNPVLEKGLTSTNAFTRLKAARVHWRAEPGAADCAARIDCPAHG
jgi:hypothetical protein